MPRKTINIITDQNEENNSYLPFSTPTIIIKKKLHTHAQTEKAYDNSYNEITSSSHWRATCTSPTHTQTHTHTHTHTHTIHTTLNTPH
jgi:hypothetical protein